MTSHDDIVRGRSRPRAWIALPLAWGLALAGCSVDGRDTGQEPSAAAPSESALLEKQVVARLEAAGLGSVPDAIPSLTPILVRAMSDHADRVASGELDSARGPVARSKIVDVVRTEAAAVAPSVPFEQIASVFPELVH